LQTPLIDTGFPQNFRVLRRSTNRLPIFFACFHLNSRTSKSTPLHGMTYSTFSALIFLFFFVAGGLLTVLLSVNAVCAYRSFSTGKQAVIVKVVIAFVLWLGVSVCALMYNALAFWAAGHATEELYVSAERATLFVLGMNFAWVMTGWALVFWLKRQRAAKPQH